MAPNPACKKIVTQRQAVSLMTPHPLEAARLLGKSGAAIQLDRVDAARRLAAQYGSVVILKGSGTVIAGVDGEIAINPNGNAGLATAGSGDVLAGLCGALLAQGWPVWEAALAAVWLHGAAADTLVAQGIGAIGLTAGELIPVLRSGLNRLTAEQALLRR
ncbi:NAD(P)H-hydrate dehydratase [Undibacterium arcticum]